MTRRSILVASGLASLGLAQPASAELRPASADAIVAAARTCMDVVSASGLDEAKLPAQGWERATARKDGKTIALPVPIYGKGSVMIMLSKDGPPSCFVTARIRKAAEAQHVRAQLATAIGTAPVGEIDGGPFWLTPGGHAVQFATTGSQDKPSIRIAVVRSSGDKN